MSARRLAAIMAENVVGYSRLIRKDEARAVREHRQAARPADPRFCARERRFLPDRDDHADVGDRRHDHRKSIRRGHCHVRKSRLMREA